MHGNGAERSKRREKRAKREPERAAPRPAPASASSQEPAIGPANRCVPAPCLHQNPSEARRPPFSLRPLPHLQPLHLHLTSTRTHALPALTAGWLTASSLLIPVLSCSVLLAVHCCSLSLLFLHPPLPPVLSSLLLLFFSSRSRSRSLAIPPFVCFAQSILPCSP